MALLADSKLARHHEYYALLGKAHFKLGNYKQALAAFETSIERKDSLLMTYEQAAKCCQLLGEKEKARAYEKHWRRFEKAPPSL